ncbi:MAG: hypothetical protein HOG49_31930 [Candidatus Scalindua sp.]|nr:hypothetical protein [Candidatus Scalindua sp.]
MLIPLDILKQTKMFKLMLLFNLKKLIVNKRMEKLYFIEKQSKDLAVNLVKLADKIKKLKEGKQDDKTIVKVSKMEADYARTEQIQTTFKQFRLEEEYFTGLADTIKQNFWR